MGAGGVGGGPLPTGGSAAGIPGNDLFGFNLYCVNHTINGGVQPPSLLSCELYFLNWNLGTLAAVLPTVAVAGSAFIPLLPVGGGVAAGGVNVSFSFTPNSTGMTGCLGFGPAASIPATRGVTIGPLLFGNLMNPVAVLSGWSLSASGQLTPARGFQFMVNPSGTLSGPTVGNEGASIALTVSSCKAIPF